MVANLRKILIAILRFLFIITTSKSFLIFPIFKQKKYVLKICIKITVI